ncbi:DNA-packaging protein [Stappia taiwanensis]|uniref:DNA-packaging protein n=1 Tax=Stappia taiwanensis TaxID=992267 RepID=A0A838XK55_9HYPH|nr:terminase family protein [Stappia taiwanensis]MBA4610915.1 DNA-packaging protein [Stappia taiwanensis]
MRSDRSLRTGLIACAARGALPEFLAGLDREALTFLRHDWALWAHPHQLPPQGDWRCWLLMGGRGAGKTRAGAEWLRATVGSARRGANPDGGRIALVGETHADVREVMIEGVSGLLAVHPTGERPTWQPSRRRLEWPNGAVAQVFSSEDPDALRGPQFALAWCDELAKWRHPQETWDMLQFSLRLGASPRQLVTTTPRPIPLLKRIIADPATRVVGAATEANAAHLAAGFVAAIRKRYAGTRLARQELDGELVEQREGAMWSRDGLEACRVEEAPELVRVVVALDPPATSGRNSDACGLIVAGIAATGIVYVLADRSLARATPGAWARAAVRAWHEAEADCLVAEVNQGGEMVTGMIAGVDPSVPVRAVRARRGKWLRAEPVALLYEQGRVRHVGALPALEDEMTDFTSDGLSSGRSPDRLDALVYAISELALKDTPMPRLRRI